MKEYYMQAFHNKYMQNYDELMRDRKYAAKVEYKKNLYKERFTI